MRLEVARAYALEEVHPKQILDGELSLIWKPSFLLPSIPGWLFFFFYLLRVNGLALLLASFHCARLLSPICLHLFSLLLYCLTIRDEVELIKILLESHYHQARLSLCL